MIDDDSPDVIGLCDHPMPTEDEFKAAFKAAYVARFVHFGIPEHVAVDCFEAADFSDLRDYLTPEDAADEEMSYWDDDGDES